MDWLDKLDMICSLQRPMADQIVVIPLRLKGSAASVYRQLPEEDRRNPEKVKAALRRAFAPDKFKAYEEFSARRLRSGESVDVFLADLKRLASLFGGLSSDGMCCAFMAGLPDRLKQILRAGARMGSLTLDEVVDRARAVMKDEDDAPDVAAGLVRAPRGGRRPVSCFGCGEIGHLVRHCSRNDRNRREEEPQRGQWPGHRSPMRPGRDTIQCFRCRGWGHTAARCASREQSENEQRGKARAPASSRD